jgi:hypothetical protein
MLTKVVVLLHDNARPHTAARTKALLQQFNWEIFEHPPLTDRTWRQAITIWLANEHFKTNEELMDGVKNWLGTLAVPFCDEGL